LTHFSRARPVVGDNHPGCTCVPRVPDLGREGTAARVDQGDVTGWEGREVAWVAADARATRQGDGAGHATHLEVPGTRRVAAGDRGRGVSRHGRLELVRV